MRIFNIEIQYYNAQHLWYVAGINGVVWFICIVALGMLPQFSILGFALMLAVASVGFALFHEFGHALVLVYFGLKPKIIFGKEICTAVLKEEVTVEEMIISTIGGVMAGYLFLGCFYLVTGDALLPAIMFIWATLKMSISECGDLHKLMVLAFQG